MEQLPLPESPQPGTPKPYSPARRPIVPPFHQAVTAQQVDALLDKLVPDALTQEAQATHALGRQLGATEIPTGQTRWGFPVIRWSIGETVASEGPAQYKRSRLELRFAAEKLRRAGRYPESVPPTPDDILFGVKSGNAIQGQVLTQSRPASPQAEATPTAITQTIEARHAAPKKEARWRRKVVAGTLAAFALASTLLFGSNDSVESPTLARPSMSAPHFSNPIQTSPPITPEQPTMTTLTYQDGANLYHYTLDSQGEVTHIDGKLGRGENPWTLTEGAYHLLHKDASDQEVADADSYMQTDVSRQQAKRLQPGAGLSWNVTIKGLAPQQ